MERTVDRIEQPVERGASEQVEAKRLILGEDFARQSPFLRFSEDWFAAPGGFETHPHRGMETVTLVLEGALHHRDHTGADGVLHPGDVQWMPHGNERAHTLQLWLNLPAAAKMVSARYVDQRLDAVPVRRLPGVAVRIYAGASGEVRQPHGSHTPMMLLDIAVEPGHRFVQELPANYRAFLYVPGGSARVGAERRIVRAPQVAWFERTEHGEASDTIAIEAEEPFRGLLYAGPPIEEPVVAYGPFVMNSMDEIRQAVADYHGGCLTG
jgi:hypothetical protein